MKAPRHRDTPETSPATDPRVRTTITLAPELHQRVRMLALERHVTMQAWIEAAITARLSEESGR